MTPALSRLAAALLLAATAPAPAAVLNLSAQDQAGLQTRTTEPEPSARLIRTLDLSPPVATASAQPPVTPELRRRADEAALAALDALPADDARPDRDHVWLAWQRASLLQALGRREEAIAAYRQLRALPARGEALDRLALSELARLGEPGHAGWCDAGYRLLTSRPRDLPPRPDAARALKPGTDGWVSTVVDVRADGGIEYVAISSSSHRIFEQPLRDWLLRQHVVTPLGEAPGRPCYTPLVIVFPAQDRKTRPVAYPPPGYSYRDTGAARRILDTARASARP